MVGSLGVVLQNLRYARNFLESFWGARGWVLFDFDQVWADAWPRYLNAAGMIVGQVRLDRARTAGFEAPKNLRDVGSLL